jgi:hypothetical protein
LTKKLSIKKYNQSKEQNIKMIKERCDDFIRFIMSAKKAILFDLVGEVSKNILNL